MPLLQLNDAIFRDHAQDRALQHQASDGLDIALRPPTLPSGVGFFPQPRRSRRAPAQDDGVAFDAPFSLSAHGAAAQALEICGFESWLPVKHCLTNPAG